MKIQIVGSRVITLGDPIEDGVYSIEKWKEKRSNAQNRLLHGQIFPETARALSTKLGKKITSEFAKSLLKTRFLTRFHPDLGDYIIPTSKLKTNECVQFIEQSVQWVAEKCGYYIELRDDWRRSIMEEK